MLTDCISCFKDRTKNQLIWCMYTMHIYSDYETLFYQTIERVNMLIALLKIQKVYQTEPIITGHWSRSDRLSESLYLWTIHLT